MKTYLTELIYVLMGYMQMTVDQVYLIFLHMWLGRKSSGLQTQINTLQMMKKWT